MATDGYTNLSTTIEHSCQALAMDEYRKPCWAVLWTEFRPDVPNREENARADEQWIEQRWFPGAHANVDGPVQTVNERIDASVWLMCQRNADYRPLGLIEWAKRTGRDLEALIADPEEWDGFTQAVDQCSEKK